MKQFFTLQAPGRTVDSFFTQSPSRNCLSILSAAQTFSPYQTFIFIEKPLIVIK